MIDCSIIMFTRGTSQAGDKPPRYIPRPSPLDSGLRRSDEMGWPEWRGWAGRRDYTATTVSTSPAERAFM